MRHVFRDFYLVAYNPRSMPAALTAGLQPFFERYLPYSPFYLINCLSISYSIQFDFDYNSNPNHYHFKMVIK